MCTLYLYIHVYITVCVYKSINKYMHVSVITVLFWYIVFHKQILKVMIHAWKHLNYIYTCISLQYISCILYSQYIHVHCMYTCTCIYQCLWISKVFVSGILQNLNIPSNISLSLNYMYVTEAKVTVTVYVHANVNSYIYGTL